jgi:hypothetical protein
MPELIMTRKYLSIFAILVIAIVNTGSVNSQWQRLNTTGSVPHLKNASAIYEPSGNRMIVYGGRTATGISDELWSLNLTNNQWTRINPVGGPNPPARYTQNAYSDVNNNSMIIWSGQGDAGNLMNDVWYFEFASNQWHMLWPDGNVGGAPLKRYGTASVYEPVTRRITTLPDLPQAADLKIHGPLMYLLPAGQIKQMFRIPQNGVCIQQYMPMILENL